MYIIFEFIVGNNKSLSRLSTTLDDTENLGVGPGVTPKPSKEESIRRTPMTASALFSIGKRKSVGWALQRASVLAGGSDEEEDDDWKNNPLVDECVIRKNTQGATSLQLQSQITTLQAGMMTTDLINPPTSES